jgi:hypothetical protein
MACLRLKNARAACSHWSAIFPWLPERLNLLIKYRLRLGRGGVAMPLVDPGSLVRKGEVVHKKPHKEIK